ncbi:MAG: hypothetical protein ACR2H3_08560, partial [Acidimicrobiales bacterium]
VYTEFLLTHPGYTATAPLRDSRTWELVLPVSGWAGSNLSPEPGDTTPFPAWLDSLVGFGKSRAVFLSACVAGLLSLAVAAGRGFRVLAWVLAACATWAMALTWLAWHGSPIEFERHGIGSAFLLHVVVAVSVLVGATSAMRSAPRSSPSD